MADKQKKVRWLDKPSTHNLIFYVLSALCGLLLLVDFFYEKHGHLEYENWYFFHAIFGFVAYSVIVISAKGLRRLLMRKEDYYD